MGTMVDVYNVFPGSLTRSDSFDEIGDYHQK